MAIDKAVSDIVAKRLESIFRNDMQALMNKATEAALNEVRENLVVKLVSQGDHAFTVEFAWKAQEGVQDGSDK